MAIKTILVPLDGTDAGAALLEAAYAAARPFDSHLEVLHIRADPRDAIPYMASAIPAQLMSMVIDSAESAADERAAKARGVFDAFCTRNDVAIVEAEPAPGAVSAAWREETGHASEVLARRGRLVDLVVVARPVGDSPAPVTVETAMLGTGRPILVVPPDARASLAHRVVVGWNGSVVAARAVAAAMPFLAAADAVTVLTTREGAEPRAAANDLALHLAWHGVGASAQTFETGGLSVGQALLAEAQELGCDLLVIGGYGHGRMRELILGGVTRHLLAAAAMPMFVAN